MLVSGVWWGWEGVRRTPQQGEGLKFRGGVRGNGEETMWLFLCGSMEIIRWEMVGDGIRETNPDQALGL